MNLPSELGVVILGAGASRRMGKQKLLLPWQNSTVIAHLVDSWRKAGSGQVAVVRRPDSAGLELELDRIGHSASDRILNLNPEEGMFSSIIAAVCWNQWKPQLSHFLITLGDQPHLDATMLEPFLRFAREHSGRICQPSFQGRPKHPVILPRPVFVELTNAHVQNLREYLLGRSICLWETNEPHFGFDLDTPEDYARLASMFLHRGNDGVQKTGDARRENRGSAD